MNSSPWPTLEIEWNRKWSGSRAAGLPNMFGLPPADLNQPRGPVTSLTSLKEEPLGARWMQPQDQTK